MKLNSDSMNKTRKYTELVHGAWQEALQLRQSLKVIENDSMQDFTLRIKLILIFRVSIKQLKPTVNSFKSRRMPAKPLTVF